MIKWHHSLTGSMTAFYKDVTMRIDPITDDTSRVCLQIVSHVRGTSAGWIRSSVEHAQDTAQSVIDNLPAA